LRSSSLQAPSRGGASSTALDCGVLAICDSAESPDALRLKTLQLQRLVRHRGPDGSGIHVIEHGNHRSSSLAHERLAIVDPLSGNQPLFSHDTTLICSVNGEIYNHKELEKGLKDKTPFRTGSDCEVIPHLYAEVGVDVASMLDGDFAFVIVDEKTGEVKINTTNNTSRGAVRLASSSLLVWGGRPRIARSKRVALALDGLLFIFDFNGRHTHALAI
jgi:glutamine phosphoribosylpyrophosphate amidotransferase